jgi:hypothetical protein
MSKQSSHFPTPVQDIALDFVFEAVGETRINRTADEYQSIAKRLPPLKILHFLVNEKLQERLADMARRNSGPPQICNFKAGHKRIVFEPYPRTISMETIRAALETSGLRTVRYRRRH